MSRTAKGNASVIERCARGIDNLAVLSVPLVLVAGLLVGGAHLGAATASTGWGGPYPVVPVTSEATVIEGVSCVSSTYCVAVDANGNAYTYGAFGSAPFLITKHIDPHVNGNGNNMTGVSCATTTFCVAIDSQGYAVVFNGTSWGTPTLLNGDGQGSVPLLGVSCPTTTFCVVVDAATSATLYQSGVWGSPQVIDPSAVGTSSPKVNAVSCASASDCWAVDDQGDAINWNGTALGTPHCLDDGERGAPGNGDSLMALEGPTTTFCMASDYLGEALSYNGTTWGFSAPGLINSDFDNLAGISCSSANFCVVASHGPTASPFAGAVTVYQNGTWASPLMINPTSSNLGDIWTVSCATDSFCAAGSADGAMFIYQTPTPEIKIVTTRSIVHANRIPVSISCAQGPCSGNIELLSRTKVGSELRSVVLAAGRYALPLVGTTRFATVELGLTRSGLQEFARAGKRALMVQAGASVSGGSAYDSSFIVN